MARIGKEKKEAMRLEILNTSYDLFMVNGYEQTSTSEIAKKVGIAEGTVFNYFKTKADILMAVFTEIYMSDVEKGFNLDPTVGIVEMYIQFFKKVMNKILLLPKKMLLELFLTIFNVAKKKPDMIKKMAEIDFKFIDDLCDLSLSLQEKGLLKKCDPRILAENIYAVAAYEVMIYLYEAERTRETMYENVEKKIKFTLEGYILTKE